MQALEKAIAEHPFLKDIPPTHLKVLAGCAMQCEFMPGELIFREGDPANRFYLIQSGTVALEARVPDRGTILIQTIGAGDVLGWSWLLPPYVWHFDARATEPVQAIFLYGTRLREHCEQDPALGYEMMRRMAGVILERLQATRRQLLDLYGMRSAGR